MSAIHWKQGPQPGLRCFESAEAARMAGQNLASLSPVAGLLLLWPPALGAVPDDATVATWVAEYDVVVSARNQRRSDVKTGAEGDNFVDKLRDATPAQITQFVQNNVTDLASAKQFLAKLGIAVAYTLQGGKDK